MKLPFPLRLCSVALAFTVGTLGAQTAAPVHAVNFSPAWKVGQLYSVEVVGEQSNRATLTTGKEVLKEQSQSIACTMRADAEALEVLANGGLKKTRYVVQSLRMAKDGGAETDYLPKGAVIVAERTGKSEAFTIDGKPASSEQEDVLQLVTSTDSEGENDQSLFGPSKPVAVGESWSINIKGFLDSLDNIKSNAARGTMKLDAFEGSGETGIAVVSGKITLGLQDAPLPPAFKSRSGNAVFELTGRIPGTRSAGAERQEGLKGVFTFKGETTGADGRVIVMQITSKSEQRSVVRFR